MDTVAVDRVQRLAGRAEGVAVWNGVMALGYSLDLDESERVLDAEFRFSQPGLLPERTQALSLRPDSTEAGGAAAAPPDRPAVPYFDQVPGLLEQVVRRAREVGGQAVDVPVLLQGRPYALPVRFPSRDSALVDMGSGRVARLVVDVEGRILRGTVPALGLSIERVGSLPPTAYVAQHPYGAPAGAPYLAEEVRVVTPAGDTLAGTLTLPTTVSGPAPAVVTATGSGRHDRNYSGAGNPYVLGRQLADALGRRGVAVLRLDDRGVGASTGDWANATWADEADDVRAALAYLRARPEVDAARVALVGHSSGGAVAAMVAAGDPALLAVALLAAPGAPMRQVVEEQTRIQAERHPRLRPDQRDSTIAADLAAIERQAETSPRTRFLLGFDPVPYLEQVDAPVFIGQGTHDFQVLPEHAERVAAAVRRGGNADVTVRIYSGVNHMLLRDPFGHPAEYGRLATLWVPEEVVTSVADWLESRLR